MAVVFDNCYGCIELRKGCLTIGYIKLILTILVIKVSIVGIMYGDLIMRLSSKYHGHGGALITNGLIMVIVFSIILAMCLFQLAFAIVLLVGIHQNKRGHVKAYLIFDTVLLVLFTIGSVLNVSLVFFTLNSICGHLIGFSITAYNFMVIRSYYIRMGQDFKPDKERSLP